MPEETDSVEVDSGDLLPTDTPEGEAAPDKGSADEPMAVLEKRLADTQRKLTELGQANAELRGKLSMVKTTEEPEEDFLDKITDEQVAQDPMIPLKALKAVKQDLITQVADLVKARDKFFMEELQKNSPERIAMREKIDALKEDPDLAGLDDNALLVIAKKFGDREPERSRPPGAPGGRVPAATKQKDVRQSQLFKMVYGDRFEEKK